MLFRSTPERTYECMRGIFTGAEAALLADRYAGAGGGGGTPAGPESSQMDMQPTLADEISRLELSRYMRNQLLRDSDVMSMAWGLELRVPFVDRLLVEALGRIPSATRLARGKRLLLEAVPEIPAWIAGQPKRGFSFPFEHWMRHEWADIFRRFEELSPVRLTTWYRRWSVFALENVLERQGMG